MAEIFRGVVSDSEASGAAAAAAAAACEGNSRSARRRMEIRRFQFAAEVPEEEGNNKRRKIEARASSLPSGCLDYGESSGMENEESRIMMPEKEMLISSKSFNMILNPSVSAAIDQFDLDVHPKYGVASVCGRRRDMEDTVAVHPSFFTKNRNSASELHFFGVYDGHGCSHVATRCRDRLHELVREQLTGSKETTPTAAPAEWKSALVRSFWRMDKEVIAWNEGSTFISATPTCKCEMQTPECDAVGSTAVVAIVTPSKIVVANCGDSRAVLCRNGKPVPLSTDHKPDRPDELNRIQAAGGRVIYWDCPRVLGVLGMSRSIGDNYLKPYVSCEPEVTITERTAEDECLILASDGLWDVVSNETACGVARMCLRGKEKQQQPESAENEAVVGGGGAGGESNGSGGGEMSDKACTDASMLLTKLALARHSTDNVSVVVVDLRKDT